MATAAVNGAFASPWSFPAAGNGPVARQGPAGSPGRAGEAVGQAGVGRTRPDGAIRPFAEVLKDAIAEVNRLQLEAQAQTEALARGEVDDLHTVALALERAQLALELTVAVRNKLIEAYQEISRMPI